MAAGRKPESLTDAQPGRERVRGAEWTDKYLQTLSLTTL